jgi:hypothetical protein
MLYGDTRWIKIYGHCNQDITKSLSIIDNALFNSALFPYWYGNIKRYKSELDSFGFDKTTYNKMKLNFKHLKQALNVLVFNDMIVSYTLRSNGYLKINWNYERVELKDDNEYKSMVTETSEPMLVNKTKQKKQAKITLFTDKTLHKYQRTKKPKKEILQKEAHHENLDHEKTTYRLVGHNPNRDLYYHHILRYSTWDIKEK